jgi:hypothetical protein
MKRKIEADWGWVVSTWAWFENDVEESHRLEQLQLSSNPGFLPAYRVPKVLLVHKPLESDPSDFFEA